MQRSNLYIIAFSAIMTIVLGGLLSITAVGLKPMQQKAIRLDTRKQILSAVMELTGKEDVLTLYDQRTKSLVVTATGEVVKTDKDGNPLVAEEVNVGKEYKKPVEERLLPVFQFMSESDPNQTEAYILPVYGNGLWNKIWGFVALETDLNTIKGFSMDHKAETPGLGARITSKDIQNRYVGKKLFDDQGNLVSVEMLKGERGDPSLFNEHQVDGMSGATLTAKGVNKMLKNYIDYYRPFFKRISSGEELTSIQ